MVYNRFDYEYGSRPQWVDNERVRAIKIAEVSKVLDALSLTGFTVINNKGKVNAESFKIS